MDNTDADTVRAAAITLGLPPATDAETVREKLRAAMVFAGDLLGTAALSSHPDPAEFVPMSVFQETAAELNRLRQGVTRETAERHVGEQIKAGLVVPFMREWAVDLCTMNKPAFETFCANLGPSVSAMIEPQVKGRRHPLAVTEGPLTEQEEAVRANLGLTVEEFKEAAR